MKQLFLLTLTFFSLSCDPVQQALWGHDRSNENSLSYEVNLVSGDGNYLKAGLLQFDWDNEGKITGQWIVNQNIHKVSGELNDSWFVIELLPYGVDCGESIRGTISSDKKTIQGDWDQMTIIGPLSGSFNGFSTNTQY